MAIQTHIDPERGLVYNTVSGDITSEDVIHVFEHIVAHPDFEPGMSTLWDLRQGSLDLLLEAGLKQVAKHVSAGIERRGPHFKLAVVAPRDLEFGVSRMFEAFSEGMSFDVEIFRDLKGAMEWLSCSTSELCLRSLL